MTKDRIVMVKRAKPKKVRLPDGRTFVARYKRATKQRAAPKGKRRQLRGFKSAFGKVVKFAKKVGRNKTFRKIARNVLEEAPGIIQGLSQKTKNK